MNMISRTGGKESFCPHCKFDGKMVIVGFGSVGQAVLPLFLRHIEFASRDNIQIITGDDRGRSIAEDLGIQHTVHPLTRENYRDILASLVTSGDFLLNLSVDVSSVELIEFCIQQGVQYLDTCIEPWGNVYTNVDLPLSSRTNYGLREEVMALREKYKTLTTIPTILPTHGANPGLISHFVKQALVNLAKDILGKGDEDVPQSQAEWANLARDLGVKVIHCSERDTQVVHPSFRKKKGEFVNTWSADGFISEGSQPSEMGWGTHEKSFPSDASHHNYGCKSAIYLTRPGASVQVRTWTPSAGPFHGFLITHAEAVSISNFLSVKKKMLLCDMSSVDKEAKDDNEGLWVEEEVTVYRPTCHYAYHPCDDTILSVQELAARNWRPQETNRIYRQEEILEGVDELGALLMGHGKGAYWFGSNLSIEEARPLAPHNTATSLQIAAGVLSGIVWVLENPNQGIVEPEDIDFRRVLEVATPYLGQVSGVYTDWTPLEGRNFPFVEDSIDESDAWQFRNIRVMNAPSQWIPTNLTMKKQK